MLKIGILRLLTLVAFGFVVPFALHHLRRRIGSRVLLALALVIGLGYGALKADNSWGGQGLVRNVALIATSGVAVLAYVAISVGAAGMVAKAISR
jgi:hypothetical protein